MLYYFCNFSISDCMTLIVNLLALPDDALSDDGISSSSSEMAQFEEIPTQGIQWKNQSILFRIFPMFQIYHLHVLCSL